MQILNKIIGERGSFYIEKNGKPIAEMVYSLPEENKMVIEHTEVDTPIRGKHIGQQLVDAAVDYARASKMLIYPRCSFASSILKKNQKYKDVLTTS